MVGWAEGRGSRDEVFVGEEARVCVGDEEGRTTISILPENLVAMADSPFPANKKHREPTLIYHQKILQTKEPKRVTHR